MSTHKSQRKASKSSIRTSPSTNYASTPDTIKASASSNATHNLLSSKSQKPGHDTARYLSPPISDFTLQIAQQTHRKNQSRDHSTTSKSPVGERIKSRNPQPQHYQQQKEQVPRGKSQTQKQQSKPKTKAQSLQQNSNKGLTGSLGSNHYQNCPKIDLNLESGVAEQQHYSITGSDRKPRDYLDFTIQQPAKGVQKQQQQQQAGDQQKGQRGSNSDSFIGNHQEKDNSDSTPAKPRFTESFVRESTSTLADSIMPTQKERLSTKHLVAATGMQCMNHKKKKAKYVQFDFGTDPKNGVPRYYCSDCAVEAALMNVEVQKLSIVGSTMPTEESHDAQSTLFTESNCSETGTNSKNAKHHVNVEKREAEITRLRQQVQQAMRQIPSLEQYYQQEKNQLDSNLSSVNQKIQSFKNKMITVIQEQAEATMGTLNTEFSKEMSNLVKFSETLKGLAQGLQEVNMDIENNHKKFLNNVEEEPYRTIMERYSERIRAFEQFMIRSNNICRDTTKFLPSENLSYFKRRLKTVINEAFADSQLESSIQIEPSYKTQEDLVSSPVFPKMKSIGEFGDFLKSPEGDEALKIMVPVKNEIMMSFGNKDHLQIAMQSSLDGLSASSFPQSHLESNMLMSEPEEHMNPSLIYRKIPIRGCFGLEKRLAEEISFSDDTSSEYRDWSMSSQMMSEESSLNKYMSLFDEVNQKQNNRRNCYMKIGSLYDMGKKAPNLYYHENLKNFIENKLKDENNGVRHTCQKSLFQNRGFNDDSDSTLIY